MRSQDTTATHECRPFERRWRNYCVDRGLKDDWLERLNALKIFDLISICEGHEDEADVVARRLPHFNLRVRENMIGTLERRWSSDRERIGNALDGAFENRFVSAKFEMRSGFIKERKAIEPQDIALLKIGPVVDVLDFDRIYYGAEWFEENIAAAEAFDQFLFELLNADRNDPE